MCSYLLHAPLLGTWLATQACALTGNRTSDCLVCSLVFNPVSHTSQALLVIFWGNSILFPTGAAQSAFPPTVWEGPLFSTSSPALVSWCIDGGHSDRCEVTSHCGFSLHQCHLHCHYLEILFSVSRNRIVCLCCWMYNLIPPLSNQALSKFKIFVGYTTVSWNCHKNVS